MARRIFRGLARRAFTSCRVFWYRFLSTNRAHGRPRRNQPLYCAGDGDIRVADTVNIGVAVSPAFFSTYAYLEARNASARIRIEHGTWINNDFCAIAEHTEISIGRHCLIGPRVRIFDSDFHGLEVSHRSRSLPDDANPVSVGDNVFIGGDVTILKGVSVGEGAVIGNNAVVTRDVPPRSVVGGNPAKVLRKLEG